MTDNKSNKTVKNNFDDYGTVSTNKMDITELDINNTNELESLCQQLLSTNHFERQITTWDGVQFTSDQIHKIAKDNDFEIIEEGDDKTEYYMLTFQSRN